MPLHASVEQKIIAYESPGSLLLDHSWRYIINKRSYVLDVDHVLFSLWRKCEKWKISSLISVVKNFTYSRFRFREKVMRSTYIAVLTCNTENLYLFTLCNVNNEIVAIISNVYIGILDAFRCAKLWNISLLTLDLMPPCKDIFWVMN